MAHVIKDRVKQTCSAPSTSDPFDFTGSATETGFQTFVDALADGDTVPYAAHDSSGNWETGLGTWTEASDQLARSTIYASSNSGAAETFSGTVTVVIANPAEYIDKMYKGIYPGTVIVQNDGTTQQTVGAVTFVKMQAALDDEVLDELGWWDNSTGRFQPTRAGRYLCMFGAQLATVADGTSVIAALYLNGSDHRYLARAYNSIAGGNPAASGAAIINLNGSSDYVECFVYNSHATNAYLTFQGAPRVWFMAVYVGEAA